MAKKKNPHAVALGKIGGKKSRDYLSPEEKTALGRKAALARWSKKEKP